MILNKRLTEPDRNRGMALVLVLIMTTIGALILSVYVSTVTEGTKTRGTTRRGMELRLVAESGANLGASYLKMRMAEAKDGNYSSFPSDCVNAGLVPGDRTENMPIIHESPEDSASTNVLKVWVIPEDANGSSASPTCSDLSRDSGTPFPKVFTIVSTATNMPTGQSYTVESRSRMGFGNWSQFSFAMRNPTLPPNATRLEINPATIEGRVHFGLLPNPADKIYFNGWPGTEHVYRGPVTFEREDYPSWDEDLPPEDLYPFEFSSSTTLTMEKGYMTGMDPKIESSQFTDLASKADYTLPGVAGDRVCLKFFADGTVGRYACFDDTQWGVVEEPRYQFKYRYVGEVANDFSGALAPLETFPTDNTIFFSDADISVKGVVNGKVTVVTSGNIVIEGDIQYADQSETSDDMAGFIAKNDIVIPHGVPHGYVWDGKWFKEQDPESAPFYTHSIPNVANFVVTPDRDYQDPDYVKPPWYNCSLERGEKNSPHVLDLDGMFLAAEGSLVVDGIWNWDENPTTGIMIPTWEGGRYSTEVGAGISNSIYQSYEVGSDTYWTRVDENGDVTIPPPNPVHPLYPKSTGGIAGLGWGDTNGPDDIVGNADDEPRYPPSREDDPPNPDPIMLFTELPRPESPGRVIWIYGGLVVNDFSYTKVQVPVYSYQDTNGPWPNGPETAWDQGIVSSSTYTNVGFDRRVIKYDKRLATNAPPGFFDTGETETTAEWRKEYAGKSNLLD